LADLGYAGEADTFKLPAKKSTGKELTIDQQSYNALLKTTYKVLRRYRDCPWRLGAIVAAALVLLHHEHHRTHMTSDPVT
jgi:hypothetical protein